MFSTFPGGSPGFGLLILRLALGMTALFGGAKYLSGSVDSSLLNRTLGFFLIVAVVFLLMGFLTPLVAFMTLTSGVLSLASAPASIVTDIYLLVLAAAVIFLGPGAFSLDARLFGRRELVIPKAGRNE